MQEYNLQELKFFSPLRGTLSFPAMVEDIALEAHLLPQAQFRILVGTDSESVDGAAKFVTAVVLWHVGHGARAFRMITTDGELAGSEGYRIYERIRRETMLTGVLAQELRSALRDIMGDDGVLERLEVHADVGPNGKTSKMMQEVIGVLKAYGFPEACIRIKPEAVAASSVADRYI